MNSLPLLKKLLFKNLFYFSHKILFIVFAPGFSKDLKWTEILPPRVEKRLEHVSNVRKSSFFYVAEIKFLLYLSQAWSSKGRCSIAGKGGAQKKKDVVLLLFTILLM